MFSKEEDYINNEYYSMNLQFFRLIGLCQKTTSKNIIHISLINFILSFALFEQIHFLIISEKKILVIVKLLETTLSEFCFASCYWNLLLNYGFMKKILYRIKSDWDDLANKPELMILKKYAEVSKLSTLTIAIFFFLYIVFLISPPFLSAFRYVFGVINETELILPVPADYFMKNRMFYYIGLTIEYVIILIASTVGIANYSMFIVVVQHACALLSIVHCQIPFYSLSLETQNLLLFLIMRSMKPCNLSVKGAIVVSNDLFATIMRKSFSFAMVLYSLQ
ncbi:uncharacterized protein LOC124957217 [Vespa velutina]|uniref:uncharacterized protein LOC124957217 n=1 Tax=Vespa velutina TaxID=202808 RepID=UPI001FB4FB92|nr:uncharacterized protein LOC124957217 [Vespa velutina]